MKKPKLVKPFFFKDKTHQDIVNELNKELPINIRYNEKLVNRISARYPLLNKLEISIIVLAVFQSFRDLLVLGKVLNFNKLFFDTKLFFFAFKYKGHIVPAVRVKMKTPPKLRKK